MIVVGGSEFMLCTFTVIAQRLLLKGLSVKFRDGMGCKKEDVMLM